MKARFRPSILRGSIDAPPSKSMSHRYLLGSALSGERCTLSGVSFSEDVLATMDCLRALGAVIKTDGDVVTVEGGGFMKCHEAVLPCRESGSTLRFFLPLALCLGEKVRLQGSERLLERPLDVYQELCREKGFLFEKGRDGVSVCGRLQSGHYRVRGDVSSQFITGLVLALVYLGKESVVEILPPLESRSYWELTLEALSAFGAKVSLGGDCRIEIRPSRLHAYTGRIEGDYSNAAFLDAFNCIGSCVRVGNLRPDSRQGDRVYREYFARICAGTPTLDLSDCPDLGPVLFALAALKNGAVFTGTRRLKAKESDRGLAMHQELSKLGGALILEEDRIIVPKQTLSYGGDELYGHNDHRIVMALSLILSKIGGCIEGAQAVKKSYPDFFKDIQGLGAEVEWEQAQIGEKRNEKRGRG